jgi:hypothetical protein
MPHFPNVKGGIRYTGNTYRAQQELDNEWPADSLYLGCVPMQGDKHGNAKHQNQGGRRNPNDHPGNLIPVLLKCPTGNADWSTHSL